MLPDKNKIFFFQYCIQEAVEDAYAHEPPSDGGYAKQARSS